MFNYLIQSFARKKARRITQVYPPIINKIDLGKYGVIDFANWSNPLVPDVVILEQMVDFFKRFIKKGDLAIDIGANIGDTTVPMAICTGTDGLTIGFDPNPFVFSILEKNSTLNTDKYKIIPEKYAISAKSEEYFFISSEASFANGGISEKSDSKHGKFVLKEKINGVNLKKFLETKYPDWISKLSFIKIDAEGYDKEIIKSISDLIKKYNPVIVAESFGKASDDAKKELFDVIKSNDYTIYYFEDFNIDLKIEKLNSNTDMTKFNHTINVYGIPNK